MVLYFYNFQASLNLQQCKCIHRYRYICIRYDFDCIQTDWDWAMCTACFLPNTITDYIDIKARGLCSRTEFDTSYQGKP